jgi:Arc/MetJ family transcription regulator
MYHNDDAQKESSMRTTINLDDQLLAEAQHLTGINERTALVREALRALIQRESAQRLARLGGTEPDLMPIERRRSEIA